MIIRALEGVGVEIESEKQLLVLEASKDYGNVKVITTSKENKITKSSGRIFSWPGEYEVGSWSFKGIEADNNSVIFAVNIEGMYVVHLGSAKEIKPEALDAIDNIDVLVLPLSENYLSPKEAKELLSKIEPRIIIPVGDMVDSFLELIEDKSGSQAVPKATITKLSLPVDKTEIIRLV